MNKPFIADLHIHSRYSIATSKDLTPEFLDLWARIKGVTVVATGDFTHPAWFKELKEKLEPAEEGLFRLKESYRLSLPVNNPVLQKAPVRFILSSEISNIYKKDHKVRKVHNVILAPDFETVEKIQTRLSSIGNLSADGRPILGLDSRDLLEIVLEANPHIIFIPAHIWTPWFSVLGSKSGFDSVKACFQDLTDQIFAVETGLSTDPAMNWMCSFLDRFTLVSNSDAHSPEKIGRNANIFKCQLSYSQMRDALSKPESDLFGGTIDLFPQEGKYHYDGHRKCGVRWDPVQTLRNRQICPVCGSPVTVGVMNRVVALSDREDILTRPNRKPFYSIIPLKELLAEILNKGVQSKAVKQRYLQLIQNIGSEFDILLNLPLEELSRLTDSRLVEAIRRMRNKEVFIEEGFDGQYGVITVFSEQEQRSFGDSVTPLFVSEPQTTQSPRGLINISLKDYHRLKKELAEEGNKRASSPVLQSLNPKQQAAVTHFAGPAVVEAGPGTGKTQVLTQRIAWLISEKNVSPSSILAVTFTNQAAREMAERVRKLLSNTQPQFPMITTFHKLGLHLLRLRHPDFNPELIDDQDKQFILQKMLSVPPKEVKKTLGAISNVKQNLTPAQEIKDPLLKERFELYQTWLKDHRLYDLDDLLYLPVNHLQEDSHFRQAMREKFQFILVDEFQDVNFAQYRLLQLLAPAPSANITVIGDPNQAIYGFRGSRRELFFQFFQDYSTSAHYQLQTSYRCTQAILDASEDVLAQDGNRLIGYSSGVKISIVQEATEKSEAEWLARTIERMLGGVHFFSMDSGITTGHGAKGEYSPSDFAILTRTARLFPAIEKALTDHRLPFQVISDQQKEQCHLLAGALLLTAQPQHPFLRLRFEHLLSADNFSSLLTLARQNTPHGEKIPHLASLLNLPQSTVLCLQELLEQNDHDPAALLAALRVALPGDEQPYQVEGVKLMTLHASKGLEFKVVFIVGVEEKILPYYLFSDQPEREEEEQRLLYVGMTRAQEQLFLTRALRRTINGRPWHLEPSRYLQRIEKRLLDFLKAQPKKRAKHDPNQLDLFS